MTQPIEKYGAAESNRNSDPVITNEGLGGKSRSFPRVMSRKISHFLPIVQKSAEVICRSYDESQKISTQKSPKCFRSCL